MVVVKQRRLVAGDRVFGRDASYSTTRPTSNVLRTDCASGEMGQVSLVI